MLKILIKLSETTIFVIDDDYKRQVEDIHCGTRKSSCSLGFTQHSLPLAPVARCTHQSRSARSHLRLVSFCAYPVVMAARKPLLLR